MTKVIEVKGLGKKYLIKQANGPRYQTLRDKISQYFSNIYRQENNEAVQTKREFWALRDINFNVSQGERVGIIGANGAGKSTLLKVLIRLTEPTTGQVSLRGRMASLLEVNTGFHPELTGRENIYLKGAIHGMSRRDINRRFDDIVAFAGVEQFLETPVKFYSSGMYVRLAFSVAAHLEPEILVVDEVLAVGDASFQQRCLGKMNEDARQGRTVLFVSHNMPAIRSLCNRAIVLDNGQIVFDGDPGEAVNHYLSRLSHACAEMRWSDAAAPGNEYFRYVAVRCLDSQNNLADRIANDAPFSIEVEYEVLEPDSVMGVTIYLSNFEGDIIFGSISNHDAAWHGRPRPVGVYRSRCHIPGNLLNEKSYRVSVVLWRDSYTMPISVDGVVTFDVYDTGTLRGDYFGGWPGAITPKLDWTTEVEHTK